ncbi:MAG: ribonuclease J [Chloroflexota bacterium]
MKLQIVPLGGLGEIGKNMMAVSCGDDMILIDAGLTFPEEEMLGIDIVIPDMSYVLEHKDRLRGVLLTHGHEDHIGALPYLLRQVQVPVYGTKLTLGFVQGKLAEHGLNLGDNAHIVKPRDRVRVGCFDIEFFRVNHSIADAVGLGIHTPLGLIVDTGDFKLDQTPVDGEVFDLQLLARFGQEGVLVLISDSTNAERSGFTPSERIVGQRLRDVFRQASGRVLVATFASNVHRMQQVIDAAAELGKRVAAVGRSVINTVDIATDLGYLHAPPGTLVDIDEANKLPPERVILITTGSQGEPMSALSRIAMDDHRKIEIKPGDTVVVAATPVPGNEKFVARTVDHLFRRGAKVIYGAESGVHVSGHASSEELKLVLNLTRPKFFIPAHGEYRHLIRHAELAKSVGIEPQNVFVAENGSVLEFTGERGVMLKERVTAGHVLVDGLGVGDVGTVVLRDRKQLAEDGVLIAVLAIDQQSGELVSGPDVVSRGFVYVRESEELLEETKLRIREAVARACDGKPPEWQAIKAEVRDSLARFLYERTRRRPMILPIIMDV